MGNDRQPDLREYLAAERTFLAYIRTALALMGFGFVVARFSLLIKELAPYGANLASPGLSPWFGSGLVILGVGLNVMSVFEYRSLIDRLNRAHSAEVRAAWLPIITAILVSIIGIAMATYLLWLS